jgi:nucleotide-binding universal stress UspA family protein
MAGMLKRIMATTDGSDRAYRAVSFASGLAEKYGAVLSLIHIRADGGEAPDAVRKQAEQARAELVVLADERPAEAICRYAEEADIDAIVLGNYGMSERKQFLMSNVPNRVSHNAPCSVIIVDTRDDAWKRRSKR